MEPNEETRAHVLKMLRLDHKRLQDYFFQFDQSNEPTHKLSFAQTALNELAIHTRLEEDIFYPFVQVQKPLIGELIDRCRQQHSVVDNLIDELNTSQYSAQFEKTFFQIIDQVCEHIQFEENEILIQLDDIDLGAIAPVLETRRNELLRQEADENKKSFTPQTVLFNQQPKRHSA